MEILHRINNWHKTRLGLLSFAALELILSYAFVSWAIDSGRLSAWTIAIILAIGSLLNFGKLIRNVVHGNKTAKA